MFNYATKTDLKNVTHIDTSSFALKENLASLKTQTDQLGIDKLAPVPVNFCYYDKLVEKVNNIDTSGFVLKTKYDADKSELV